MAGEPPLELVVRTPVRRTSGDQATIAPAPELVHTRVRHAHYKLGVTGHPEHVL